MRQAQEFANTIVGGTVFVTGSVNLGSTAPTVTLASSVITGAGTYTLFRTGTGIIFNGVTQTANSNLIGKINVVLPAGYAVQSLSVDSTGLNATLVVRIVAN